MVVDIIGNPPARINANGGFLHVAGGKISPPDRRAPDLGLTNSQESNGFLP
jgi:hypothetical protein